MRSFYFLVLVTVLFYLSGMVAAAEFNPFLWTKDVRQAIGFTWLAVAIIGSMFTMKGGPLDDK